MRRLVLASAFATFTFAALDASAFCRSTTCRDTATKKCAVDENQCPSSGAPLRWPTTCLAYAMNRLGTQSLDPADTRPVIAKAFAAWTDVKCKDGTTAKMAFTELEPIKCKKSEYNKDGPNVNVVLFQDNDWKYRGIDGTLAKTSVTYNDDTGEIYDADIEVNAANNEVTIDDTDIEYDLQAILTHEVGHFIGIAHSARSDAVMYASYSPGSVSQRVLTDDDIAALCEIYPSTYDAACNTEPKNGYSPTCDDPEDDGGICAATPGARAGGGLSYGVATIFLGSGLWAARRRRRRRLIP
ncbi:MAG: matrixin family metalloprotease [Labilithrix sp.]